MHCLLFLFASNDSCCFFSMQFMPFSSGHPELNSHRFQIHVFLSYCTVYLFLVWSFRIEYSHWTNIVICESHTLSLYCHRKALKALWLLCKEWSKYLLKRFYECAPNRPHTTVEKYTGNTYWRKAISLWLVSGILKTLQNCFCMV